MEPRRLTDPMPVGSEQTPAIDPREWVLGRLVAERQGAFDMATRSLRFASRSVRLPPRAAVASAAVLAAIVSAVWAQDIGDRSKGLAVAREACASCHAIRQGEKLSPNPAAPSFERIASVPGMTTLALTVALRTSHRTMPNLMLEDQELRVLAAYILSLKQEP